MILRAHGSVWTCLFVYVLTGTIIHGILCINAAGLDLVRGDAVEERISSWASRHGFPLDSAAASAFDSTSAASNLSSGLDGLFTEQLAETFLTKFLDTKRIEDFVKSIPAGQEPLQLLAAVPKSTLPSSKGISVY